jgi:hypothetical protein
MGIIGCQERPAHEKIGALFRTLKIGGGISRVSAHIEWAQMRKRCTKD